MTPEQFKFARQDMGLTHEQLAFILRSDIGEIHRWESGACRIPGPVEIAIFLFEHCCDINVHPDGSVSYSNRYLKIAERHGYKVPPGHDGPLPPQGAA